MTRSDSTLTLENKFIGSKAKLHDEYVKTTDKLTNTLSRLNGLSMNNLHQIGYTQDLQRALLKGSEDNKLEININRLDYKRSEENES